MKEFKIKKETRVPDYSSSGRIDKIKKIINGTGALLLLTSTVNCWGWATAGVPYYEPIPRNEAIKLIDSVLIDKLKSDMTHDIVFNFSDGTNDMVFIADGYDMSNDIYYECIDSGYYDITDDTKILSFEERKLIKDYKFGTKTVLFFYLLYNSKESLINNVNNFVDYYLENKTK